jgi:hypothetical protein
LSSIFRPGLAVPVGGPPGSVTALCYQRVVPRRTGKRAVHEWHRELIGMCPRLAAYQFGHGRCRKWNANEKVPGNWQGSYKQFCLISN